MKKLFILIAFPLLFQSCTFINSDFKIIELAQNNPQFSNKSLQVCYVSIDNVLQLVINAGNLKSLNVVDWQKIGGKIVATLNAGKYQEAIPVLKKLKEVVYILYTTYGNS